MIGSSVMMETQQIVMDAVLLALQRPAIFASVAVSLMLILAVNLVEVEL